MTTPDPARLTRAGVLLLITLLLAMTWGFGAWAKLFGGGVPEWFSTTFGETFLARFPGLTASFYSIALLEALAGVLAAVSLVRAEFLRPGVPLFLVASLLMSLLLFVQLNFGKQLVRDFAGQHDLFMYFVGTLVMLLAVRALGTPTTSTTPTA